MLDSINLFHLHFFCKNIQENEEFLVRELGFKILGRFSIKEGLLPEDTSWEDIITNNIRLRLIELQKGGVNIVLMPGKFETPKLEHFGFLLAPTDFDRAVIRAKDLGLRVQERPNRTFISSKLGFRIEIHKNNESSKVSREDFDDLHLKEIVFYSEDKESFLKLLKDLFRLDSRDYCIDLGKSSLLKVEAGEFGLKHFRLDGKYSNSLSESNLSTLLPLEF